MARLNIKAYFANILVNDASLVAALGGKTHIVPQFPMTFNDVPLLYFREVNQYDVHFADNRPDAVRSIFDLQVFTGWNTDTHTICNLITTLLTNNGYSMNYSEDLPDPEQKFQRRIMRFSRDFTSDDIDNL